MSVSHVAECPDLGPECAGPIPPTPYNHHVEEWTFETGITAALALVDGFEIETRFALRVVDVNPTYSELDGTPKQVPNDIHHHDETLVDVTDPWLLGRFAHDNGPFIGSLQAGLSFPLGRTEEDPYRLGQLGLSHEHLQGGTGTFVPIVGFAMSYTVAPVTMSLSGLGFINAYENDKGYRAPSRLYANHRVTVSLVKDRLRPFAELSLAHETEEYWHGSPGLEGSAVRTELYGGTGLAVTLYDRWSIDASLRGRIATLTDAPTFEIPLMVGLGLSTSFDLWKPSSKASETPAEIEERTEGGTKVFEKKRK